MIRITTLAWIISAITLIVAGFWYGRTIGSEEGIDLYHSACYEGGGIIIIDEKLRVVTCRGLIQLPKKEEEMIKKDLDKSI